MRSARLLHLWPGKLLDGDGWAARKSRGGVGAGGLGRDRDGVGGWMLGVGRGEEVEQCGVRSGRRWVGH